MYGFDLVGNSFKQCFFFSRGGKKFQKETIKDCKTVLFLN